MTFPEKRILREGDRIDLWSSSIICPFPRGGPEACWMLLTNFSPNEPFTNPNFDFELFDSAKEAVLHAESLGIDFRISDFMPDLSAARSGTVRRKDP